MLPKLSIVNLYFLSGSGPRLGSRVKKGGLILKIVALGGSGAMGQVAIRTLLAEFTPDELVIADINVQVAEEFAASLETTATRVKTQALDVTDGEALRHVLSDADLVMNSTGPFFRFGVPILQAAIDTQTNYIDICDDAEPTVEMLTLDEKAKRAGITAVIGAGASPGFMNLLAAEIVKELDEVTDVISAWSFDSEQQDWDMLRSFKGKSQAALVHFLEQATGQIHATRDGELVEIRPMQPFEIDIEGLGSGVGHTVGHPEPVTFPRSFSLTGSSTSLCMMTGHRMAEFRIYLDQIEAGDLSLERAAEWILQRDKEVINRAQESAANYGSVGTLPIYMVVARGKRDGTDVFAFAGTRTKPEDMALATGAPFGIAVATIATGQFPAGVFAPEQVIEPNAYFDRVAHYWNIAREDLYFTGLSELGVVRELGAEVDA